MLLKSCAVLLITCATALVSLAIRRERAGGSRIQQDRATYIAEWRAYTQGGYRIGPADAPVSVVAFSDYECPFSRELAERLGTLLSEMPSELAVVYRNFPLKGHAHADEAARAAVCAGSAGKFEPFHNLLTVTTSDSFSERPWAALALRSGVQDTAEFVRCMAAPGTAAVIAADTAAGNRLGVPATPTLLINDQKYEGLPAKLEEIIKIAVRDAQKSQKHP